MAIVGGKGEGSDRENAIRTSNTYDVDTNNIEIFVNATDIDTAAGLDTRGEQKLKEVQSSKSFTFDVLQVPSCLYGVHYVLGDLVKAINPYNGIAYTMKIEAVIVSFDEDGSEKISVEMRELV